MLQQIGDALKGRTGHKWLTYAVVGALSVVFVAWGAYGIVNLSVGSSNYAAEANGEKISLEEARNTWLRQQAVWQQQLGGVEMPADLRGKLQDRSLEALIQERLLQKRTKDLGYRVSDEQLREALKSLPGFQVEGKYNPQAAKAALLNAGISEEAFASDLRNDVQRTQLEGGIRGSNFVTPQELARIIDLQDQEREVRYMLLPAERFASAAKVDDAAIAAYYKAHQAQFMTPESAHLQYAELRLDALAAQQTLSDADLHAAYEKVKDRLTVPEKRHARHILITGKDDATARTLAEQVLAQAKAGKDFGELAKQYSQDPGSAKNGGDLGWAERGSFVAPFSEALFSMSVGEIKGPIKTQFGYHIIRLDEIAAGKGKTFEEARPDLEAQLRRSRATDRFGDIQEQLQTKLSEPGSDFAALAEQFHLEQGDVPSFLKGAGAAPFGPAPQLQELVFADPPLAPGRIGGPVLLGDDRLVIFKVLEHHTPQAKPLAEVRDTIVAALTKEQSSEAALKAAESARAELDAGTPFDAIVAQYRLSADPAHFIGRSDPSVPAPIRNAAFAVPRPAGKPAHRSVALGDGSAAILAVSAVRVPPAVDPKAQFDRGVIEAQRQGENEVLAYEEQMRRTADVKKNPKAFE